jgi:type I restriction enzyme S subunit
LPVVADDEQVQIARFLDYETARIDALIEKQQQLIALLKEKRQAVISHAVTKGLNPNAPLRDSGVEWLGMVPEHWEVSRLGYLAAVGNGSTPSRSVPEYWSAGPSDGVGWLNSTRINDGEILEAEQFVSRKAIRECHLPMCHSGFVLVAITGEGQTRGRAALLQTNATINQHLAYLAPDNRRIESRFLWRQLEARYELLRDESAGGGSTRAALTCEFLRDVPICVPPLDEQSAVLREMETKTKRLDETAEKASASLGLLQERRTALISAAVTGKIDVRGWAPPEPNVEEGAA